MRSKNSKQTNSDTLKLSDEYTVKKSSDNKGRDLDKDLQNLRLEYEAEIDNIITKNKRLLAILAHDIRGPMGLVVGHLRLLKTRIGNRDESVIKAGIDNTLKSAEESFSLLENLLNWATTENNMKTFRQEYVNLANVVQKEIENIKPFAVQKQISIYSRKIPHVDIFVDENMIKSVFRNILHNAIKNTFIKGEIVIGVIQEREYVEISIKDNGIGIKEKIQKSLFINKSNKLKLDSTNESGNGFGLFLCKEIIDLHRGEIGVTSESGKGSEFKFTLPLGPI